MQIDEAKAFLKAVMLRKFNDRTFEQYIDRTLAGDFAVEIAKTIKGLETEVANLKESGRHQSDHPQKCPVTGRDFFMTMNHPTRGEVATYGGPFDSYTIPERDEDGMFWCERFDHDAGSWVDGGETLNLYLLNKDPDLIIEDERERVVAIVQKKVMAGRVADAVVAKIRSGESA